MTSDNADKPTRTTRLLFWGAFFGVTLVALVGFTFTIGDGRISGPGITLALSAGVLVWVARRLFQSARFLVATCAAAC